MAAATSGVQATRQRVRSSQDGSAPRQRELTWTLFEGMWKHKYERERKDPAKIDPKLIYQVGCSYFSLYLHPVQAQLLIKKRRNRTCAAVSPAAALVVMQECGSSMHLSYVFCWLQEFMSFIKGSAEAVSSPNGFLSLDE